MRNPSSGRWRLFVKNSSTLAMLAQRALKRIKDRHSVRRAC
jgi:hypothetical protein